MINKLNVKWFPLRLQLNTLRALLTLPHFQLASNFIYINDAYIILEIFYTKILSFYLKEDISFKNKNCFLWHHDSLIC